MHLNTGGRSFLRNIDQRSQHEYYKIDYIGPDAEQGGHIVTLRGMGRKQNFRGVTKIVADLGDGWDFIDIDHRIPVPVEIKGGEGTDSIYHYGSGDAVIAPGFGD